MKALVIGANGYIGRHLVHFLQESDIDVFCSDIQPDSFDASLSYKAVDVTDPNAFASLDFNVDLVFMMAGLAGTSAAFDRPAEFVAVNELGLLNLLNQIRKVAAKPRVIFPSTRLVYRGIKDAFLDEESPKEARTLYAANKIAAEQYLQMYSRCFGIDYSIFRICVPYGNIIGSAYSYGTLGFMLGQAEREKKISVFGDGSQKRSFTHVGDIAKILVEGALRVETKNACFNIGAPDHLSILDVATAIAKEFDARVELTEWPEMALAVESGDTMFDSRKLGGILKVSYLHTFAGWLKTIQK